MLNLTGNISIEEAARMIYPQNPGLAYEIETADEQIEQLTRRAEETEEQIGELEQTLNDVQTKLYLAVRRLESALGDKPSSISKKDLYSEVSMVHAYLNTLLDDIDQGMTA